MEGTPTSRRELASDYDGHHFMLLDLAELQGALGPRFAFTLAPLLWDAWNDIRQSVMMEAKRPSQTERLALFSFIGCHESLDIG